jgi:hypothetical protein
MDITIIYIKSTGKTPISVCSTNRTLATQGSRIGDFLKRKIILEEKPDDAIYQTAMRRRKAFSLKLGSICRSHGEVKPTPAAESSRRVGGLYESKSLTQKLLALTLAP